MDLGFSLLGWSAKGLRCPDHQVSFENGGGGVYRVAVLQMPNGTGKTTTLKLLRAALGGPAFWAEETEDPLQYRKNELVTAGEFEVKLQYGAGRKLTIRLTFDFTTGKEPAYTTVGVQGMETGFLPPAGMHAIFQPDFMKLLIFDGELAAQLLDPAFTNAQRAIEEMYQLTYFHRMCDRLTDYWKEKANANTGSAKEFNQRNNRVQTLKRRITEVARCWQEDQDELEAVNQRIHELERAYEWEISVNEEKRKAITAAEKDLLQAQAAVTVLAKDTAVAMKNPAELSLSFAKAILHLKESLDRVKLPGVAAREFFEELAEEADCICGRHIGVSEQLAIRHGAGKFLGSEEVGVLNAMKSAIKERVSASGAAPENEGTRSAIMEIKKAQHAEAIARQHVDVLKGEVNEKDPRLKNIYDELAQLRVQKGKLATEIEKYTARTDTSDTSWNLDVLKKKLELADRDLAEATNTIEYKEKRDILCRIMERAEEGARRELSQLVCRNANEKIDQLMPYNHIRIASIAQSLHLAGKNGGSAGETLAIGYAFLASLLSNDNYQLPFVIDSPAGPIDLAIRPEVGALLPKLSHQLIAFTISSEREGFVKPLSKVAGDEILFLTLFRKGDRLLEKEAKRVANHQESADGVCIVGQAYFELFHKDREENDGV